MKLNNKGWGLSTFLMFLFMFFIALIILVVVGNIISGTDSRRVIEGIEEAGN